MSFSVSCPLSGIEYSSRGIGGFFAQPRNLVTAGTLPAAARHHPLQPRSAARARRRLRRRAGRSATTSPRSDYSDEFVARYLAPMASAIWSSSLDEHPSVSGADARPLHAEPRHALGRCASGVARRPRRQPYLHPQARRAAGRRCPHGRRDPLGAPVRERRSRDCLREPAVGTSRRRRVRLPWRPGAAAPRGRERRGARRSRPFHDDDERRVAAHGRAGVARHAAAPARPGTTALAPPTMLRHQ